jgi:glycogen debranching enzyme
MRNRSQLNNEIIDQAYDQAVRVLRSCVNIHGLKASGKSRGYPHVWARDSMITLLGASLINDGNLNQAIRASFNILKRFMSPKGIMPNSVDVNNLEVNFQAYADGGLWFIIGISVFFEQTKSTAFLKKNYPVIKKILRWCEFQSVDRSGLISMQEAADWEDLFAVRGKGLYVNVLYYLALVKCSKIARRLGREEEGNIFLKKARDLRSEINNKFWFTEKKDICINIEDSIGKGYSSKKKYDALKRRLVFPLKTILKKDSYYLPYVVFRDFGEWFDSFGNLLAILAGCADKRQAEHILAFIEKYKIAKPYPIKAIYPPILSGEKDWRYYYKFGDLNLPHQYHNGGIWPFIGGFYIAALIKTGRYKKADDALLSLALLNKKGVEGQWQFNEWFHGVTKKPMGMDEQAWSAGMYIYAYESTRRRKILFF